MASSWWKACGGIALLSGAYLAGTFHPRSSTASLKHGGTEASNTRSASGVRDAEDARTKSDRQGGLNSGTGFKPATPFGPGGARDWFIATTRVNHDDSFTGFMQLIQNCTTLDERSALELAEELREICKLYEDGDPTMRALFDGDDLQERSLAATVFRLSQLNPDAAIRFLDESPGIKNRDKDELYEMVFANYALKDPAKLGDALAKMDEGKFRDAMEGAMATLTRKDPDTAFELLSRFDQPSLDNERSKLVERLVLQDPQKAIETAGKFTSAGRSPDVFASLVSTWLRKDEAAAIAWAEAYHGPGELGVKDVLIRRTASTDPRKAAADFSGLGTRTENLSHTGHVIAGKLAEVDLPATGDWVKSLPAGGARNAAEDAMLDVWLRKDPLGASSWIREMPAGENRDGASVALIRSITRRAPKEALEWAASLSDPDARNTLRAEVLKDWREQDPEAAEEAVKTQGQ